MKWLIKLLFIYLKSSLLRWEKGLLYDSNDDDDEYSCKLYNSNKSNESVLDSTSSSTSSSERLSNMIRFNDP